MESGTARFETLEDVPLKRIDDLLFGRAVPCTYIFCNHDNIISHHEPLRAD